MARILCLIALIFFSLFSFSRSLPLSTQGRWIIDARTGERVKLSCVNLVSHAQSMVAQGLDKRPLKELVAEISSRKFNCVRLTWSVHMFTRYAYETIGDVFDGLDIADVKNGVKKHNPEILKMTVAKAFQTVINALGSEKIMVILDNHISQPRWCCSLDDGNGFFGDCNFNPSEWLQGLSFVAVQFTCNPYVSLTF